MNDEFCINLTDFIISNNLFSKSPLSVYNEYVSTYGNDNITSSTINWVLTFISDLLKTDVQVLKSSLKIDRGEK